MRSMNTLKRKDDRTACQNQRKALLREARMADQNQRDVFLKAALHDFRNAAALLFQLAELFAQNTDDFEDCESIKDPTDRRFCYQAFIARNIVREMISAITLAGINQPFQEESEIQDRLFQIACRELFLAKCSGQSDLTIYVKNEEQLAVCMPRDCLTGFENETILGYDILVCESCTDSIFEDGVPHTFSRIAKCVGYDQTRDVFILEDEDGRKDYADIRCIQGIVVKEIHDPTLVAEIKSYWKAAAPKRTAKSKSATYFS
ncbi:MAG: hypothetical protein ACFFBD_00720 [Candidatus Hodarchaeota archaeon]